MSKSAALIRRLCNDVGLPVADLPAFLCPGVLRIAAGQATKPPHQQREWQPRQSRPYSTLREESRKETRFSPTVSLGALPRQCPGCGAFAQTVDKHGPGHFTLSRKSIERYFESNSRIPGSSASQEDIVVKEALANAGALGLNLQDTSFHRIDKSVPVPMCDRCHRLQHHSIGASIHHPSIKSIQSTLFESPHKYNHVYHVIDAADFPMSMVRGLHKILHLTPQRARNRRSKTGKFYHGQKTDVSFIITRSDLLAPTKEQVDSMMPYLRATLRDVLGRDNRNARLGNIKCVSAKRSWWIKELREDIYHRGGGGWMVGKVNVGKSQLFHEVFPKGRRDAHKAKQKPIKALEMLEQRTVQDVELEKKIQQTLEPGRIVEDPGVKMFEEGPSEDNPPTPKNAETLAYEDEIDREDAAKGSTDSLDFESLLPPSQPEVDYPAMPLVSSLPGTTAAPIRLSFGGGKGELIDLPGLARGDLEQYVAPEHRDCLVMKSRVTPEQEVIKPGQSLLLGGFIRITPVTPDVIMLAYPFTSIDCPHLTSTEKAVGIQTRMRETTVQNISVPGAEQKISSAGVFALKWDVTRQRAGPITRKDAANIRPENLPYCILATDILIEGCGWVEIVAQVSKRRLSDMRSVHYARADDWAFAASEKEAQDDSVWPQVEVFTPGGRFISTRRPMNAWMHIASKPKTNLRQGRPRKSMKGAKKAVKFQRRIKMASTSE